MEVRIWIRCNSNPLSTWGLRFRLGRIPRCFWFCRNRIVNLGTKNIKAEIEIYFWYVQSNSYILIELFLINNMKALPCLDMFLLFSLGVITWFGAYAIEFLDQCFSWT